MLNFQILASVHPEARETNMEWPRKFLIALAFREFTQTRRRRQHERHLKM